MNTLEFTDTETPILQEDILQLEKKYKIKLPENVHNLLLRYNGGAPVNEHKLQSLYSIKYGDLTVDYTIETLQIVEKIIPREYIPIGEDWNGNVFCISTSNDEYGKIYCCYLDSGAEMKLISDSLEEFLDYKSDV